MKTANPPISCLTGDPIQLPSTGEWICPDGGTGAYTITNPMDRRQLRNRIPPLMFNIPSPVSPSIPQTTAQPEPFIDFKNCRRHQAPPNYTYIWNGVTCQLVSLKDAPAYIKQLQAQGIDTGATGDTGGGLDNIGSQVSRFLSEHPILALAGVAGLVYMFASKGMKPKSREVVSTTRY